jgi:dienelactone hydrolase
MNVKSVIVKASAIMVATGVMCSVKATEPKSISVDSCPWPVEELLKVPQTFSAAQYVGQQVSGVTALLYESVPYRGKPTKVFAYYSAPQGKAPVGGWSAIVIAHGGGGTAYPEYVKMWNSRGYAAIAMDLYGKLPFSKGNPSGLVPLESRETVEDGWPHGTKANNRTEEWQYHAVSQIVLAHSLLRSFPEVNPEAIGLVGTSWGGVHSCIVAGIDPRFKFVVSVYGCIMGDKWYDPEHFLPQVKTPFFWITGPEDANFEMSLWQKSINITPSTVAAILVVKLGHGDNGQAYPIIARIADSVLRGGSRLPQLGKLEIRGRDVSVKVNAVKPLVRADLCYTIRGNPRKKDWLTVPATLAPGVVTATLPEDTAAFFFNVYDEPGPAAPAGIAWPSSSEYKYISLTASK